MKKLFEGFLVANTLMEAIAGIALIGASLSLISVDQLETGMWSLVYGFAALAIASAVLWVWPHRTSSGAVGPVLGILLTFHAAIAIAFAVEGGQLPIVLGHGVMAALAVYLRSQRSTWCSD